VTTDWREDLEEDPRTVELRKLMWNKWRKLGKTPGLVFETLRLKSRLEKAYEKDPETVTAFFRRYSLPGGSRIREIRSHIRKIGHKSIRDVLERYVKYVARFGVMMYIRKKKPRFRTAAIPPFGATFHVALSRGYLQPVRYTTSRPRMNDFGDEKVQMPEALDDFVRAGTTKFVRIDDHDGSSVLNQLEAFAYHREGLTFMIHEAEQPYIICLVGEDADSKMWKKAAKVSHALRRECYGEKAGKPGDIRHALRVAAQLRKPGASKAKSMSVGKYKNEESSQSAFSRMKAKLT
jgi:hypothetical protein